MRDVRVMDKFLETTLVKLVDEVSEIKTQIAVSHVLHQKNTKDLEKHIRRTDLLDKRVDILQKSHSWWIITGKTLAVLVPIVALILKIAGVI